MDCDWLYVKNCGLGKLDHITIDGRDDGIVFGKGCRNVVLRFFGWADTDRMPIRNITVDWDNGSRGGNNPGKYRNQKPYCQSSESEPVNVCDREAERQRINFTCSTNQECRRSFLGGCSAKEVSFGNTPNACSEGYFEFTGSYVFNADDQHCQYRVGTRDYEELDAGLSFRSHDLINHGLNAGDRYCVFKPKVIIIDNWGWCNGTCAEGNGKGCWGSEGPAITPDLGRCTNSEHVDYRAGKVGTPFAGWVIVAEQK